MELVGHGGISTRGLWGACQLISQSSHPALHSSSNAGDFPFLVSSPTLVFYFYSSHPKKGTALSHGAFDLHFPEGS